jgi:hypothetical protein
LIVDATTALRIMTNLLALKKATGQNLSADPVVFFGFDPKEVHCVYFWKSDREGTWFRLHDGRVFDENGKPSEPDEHLYKTPTSLPPLSE